ncbi:trimethylamine---corrinoid protein Co-methyltransferase [Desulfocicer vacuolatum DSM 3385]|uniref:Methyltransferase n=1 Tax=Desulfocicer vacuolatum DSM 3385 TaxID=1121400 RepID=A0A1W2DLB6_9BACT|nr:trimethylamine methyltransferase family protein [Desulfocicer vacuolatum]SMC98223.1 trimethylamine---corrinoid protein Co-methyltransferase [Desulfocicer vacuolatum DSM 3385]
MISSNTFCNSSTRKLPRTKIVGDADLPRIHEASIDLLENNGVIFEHDEALAVFKKHGAKVEGKTVFIPRAMAETAMDQAPTVYRHVARNNAQSVTIGDGMAPHPNVGCVFCEDMDRGKRRGLLEDYANFQKLSQASDIVKLTGATPVAPDDVEASERALYMLYETIKHTDKPLIGSCTVTKKAEESLKMVEMVFGEDYLENNYCVGVSTNPLSPLKYATETLDTVIAYAKKNQPVYLLPCALAGITAPMSVFGSIVQQNTEVLAGNALIQLINPGCPMVYCPASTVADMRTAICIYAPPEQFLINSACLQMAIDFYKVPTRIMAGMTDSKEVDIQAGYDTMQNMMMGLMSGGHMIEQVFGVLDAIMTISYEKFIIDEEMMRRVIRICEGVDTSDSEISLDVMKEVGPGGSYLSHADTFKRFKSQWLPTVSCWTSYDKWESTGKESIMARANKKYKEILAARPEMMISKDLDKDLKKFLEKVRGE